MGKELKSYAFRLDNSVCDVVGFRDPSQIFEMDGVTPISKEFAEKIFPCKTGVTYYHVNPNDENDTQICVYINPDKKDGEITAHEQEITNFKITPVILKDLLDKHDYKKKNLKITRLENLIYVIPNEVKRKKILLDGETYAMVKDLDALPLIPKMKEQLIDYNYKALNGDESQVDVSKIGLVTDYKPDRMFPVTVKFPNNFEFHCNIDDLRCFHYIEN
jgi:hypothetical protein